MTDNITKKSFADVLNELIKEDKKKHPKKGTRELTQEKIAEIASVSRPVVGRWLDGSVSPNIEEVCLLAEKMNCSVDFLLGRTKSKSIDPDINRAAITTGLSTESVSILSALNRDPDKFVSQRFFSTLNYIIEQIQKDGEVYSHLKFKDQTLFSFGAGQSVIYNIYKYIDAYCSGVFNQEYGDVNPNIEDEVKIEYGNGRSVFVYKSSIVMQILEREIIRTIEDMAYDMKEAE